MLKYMKKIIPLIVIFAFSAAAFLGCAASSTGPVVKTALAQKNTVETVFNVSGILLPKNTVSLSSKIAGTAITVNADIGAAVKKGDTLLSIDTKQLTAQLAQAEASLKQARAAVNSAKSTSHSASSAVKVVAGNTNTAKINLDAAKAAYDSIKALRDAGLTTEADLQAAKVKLDAAESQYDTLNGPTTKQAKYSSNAASNNVNTAQAAVAVAEASVNLLLLQMENTSITSPVDGIVATRSINAGELASVSVPLMTIIETDILKLKGTVSQSMLPQLQEGQDVKVTVDIYPEKIFTGKISMIAPMAVTTGEYFPIEISIPGEAFLKPGLSAHASINIKSAEHLSVPSSAVVSDKGQSFVFVLSNGMAKKLPVTAGISDGVSTEILNGLTEGQEVITSHTDILADSMKVNK